ncbi:MAG: YidC/Oxa1 family membrane protein insertase, partial [Waterburya sp.]
VGDNTQVELQTPEGKSLQPLIKEHTNSHVEPSLNVTKGSERIKLNEDGTITALEPGEATIQVTVPGIAADTGFLFIEKLGRVGVTNEEGNINFDILIMVLLFGVGMYVSQQLTAGQSGGAGADQQQAVNKITPLLFSGMFLFFPLPAGVLMYIVVANFIQIAQTWFLMREPLPEELQKILEEQEKAEAAATRDSLPFERKRSKKKEKTSG